MTGRHEKPGAELDRIEAGHIRRSAAQLAVIGHALRVARHGELDALLREWISEVTALLEEVSRG